MNAWKRNYREWSERGKPGLLRIVVILGVILVTLISVISSQIKPMAGGAYTTPGMSKQELNALKQKALQDALNKVNEDSRRKN